MFSWYRQFKLHCMFLMQSFPKLSSEVSPHCCPPSTECSPDAQFLPSAAHCQQSTSHHLTFFTSPRFTLLPAYLYQKDELAIPGNFQNSQYICFPHVNYTCGVSHCTSHFFFISWFQSAVPWLRRSVSHRSVTTEVSGSIPWQSLWDLWWTKWHWHRFFFEYIGFPRHSYSTNVPYSSLLTLRSYERDELAKYEILSKEIGNRRVFWYSLERVGLEIGAFWSLAACVPRATRVLYITSTSVSSLRI